MRFSDAGKTQSHTGKRRGESRLSLARCGFDHAAEADFFGEC